MDQAIVERDVGKPDRMEKHRFLRSLIRHIPYSIGSPLFSLLLGNLVARRIFSRQISVLKKVHSRIGKNPLNNPQINQFLQVNYTGFWRIHALMVTSASTFKKYVKVENRHFLEASAGKRGIVLCHSHYGIGKLVPVVVSRLGYDLHSLDRIDVFTHRDAVPGIGKISSIELGKKGGNFHLKQLFRCKKALEDNSILHIAADGYRGGAGIEQDFLEKRRLFLTGFADLAVSTNALVLPVFGTLDVNGHITLVFLEPVDPIELEGDKQQRVEALCVHYKRLLEDFWRESPQSVFKNDLNIYAEM